MIEDILEAAPLAAFGDARERVRRAVERIAAGGGVIVIDDETRENEGDLIFAAETLTVSRMARMIRDGSGIVQTALDHGHCQTRRVRVRENLLHLGSRGCIPRSLLVQK